VQAKHKPTGIAMTGGQRASSANKNR